MKKTVWTIVLLLIITLGLLWRTRVVMRVENIVSVEGVVHVQDVVNDSVKITFLDVGQGDASLIEFPDGQKMLVDCSVDSRILPALSNSLQFYDNTLDYLVITHPDLDHYGGCEDILKRFKVRNIIYNDLHKDFDKYWQSFWQAVEAENANNFIINKGTFFTIASSTLDFIYPDQPTKDLKQIIKSADKGDNNTSLVFILNHNNKRVLFTGDAPVEVETYLLKNYPAKLSVEILKVGHHGSSGSSLVSFLEKLKPIYAIISVGKNNRYGHPSLRVLKRLERVGAEIFRTDEVGDVICEIGESVKCSSRL